MDFVKIAAVNEQDRGIRKFYAELGAGSLGPNFLSALVTAMMSSIMVVSFAALIFSGELSSWMPYGVTLGLLTALVLGVFISAFSSYPSVVAIPQDRIAPILAFKATAIMTYMSGQATIDEIGQTVMAAILFSSLCMGLLFYGLGRFRLGDLIRFIPYPVVGGFLAGSGWLLFSGSFRVMTGTPLMLQHLEYLTEWNIIFLWLPGLVFGLVLLLVMRKFPHFLGIPAMVLGSIGLFYLVLGLLQVPISQAQEKEWLFQSQPSVAWSQIHSAFALPKAHWDVVFLQVGSLTAILVTGTVSLLLNTTALELMSDKEIDLNQELRTTGLANILSGIVGGLPGFVSLSLSQLPIRIGGQGRLLGLCSGLLCGLVILMGTSFVAYITKFILGGLLLYLGLGLLVEWVIDGWKKLPHVDYGIVLLIVLVVGSLGYLEGIGVGAISAAIMFVVGYSRINVISRILTGDEQRSNVDRSIQHTRLLQEKGSEIYIVQLQGFVFFGSANGLLQTVRHRVHDPSKPRLRYVILDFCRVSGLDSSAVLSLIKMRRFAVKESIVLVFTHLKPEMLNQFSACGLRLQEEVGIQLFRDRDHGLEWCENEILNTANLLERAPGQDLIHQFESVWPDKSGVKELFNYLERVEMPANEYLLLQGDEADEMYFIESGLACVLLELGNGRIVRIRTLRDGAMLGELGFYIRDVRTASVRTEMPCVLYRLTREALQRLETERPAIASAFHQFIAKLLAERLTHTNRTLQALLE